MVEWEEEVRIFVTDKFGKGLASANSEKAMRGIRGNEAVQEVKDSDWMAGMPAQWNGPLSGWGMDGSPCP